MLTIISKHKIEAIAIGNGTGSRESESFCRKLNLPSSIPVVVVNEAGASVYSASDVAREEFPDLDLTVRGPDVPFHPAAATAGAPGKPKRMRPVHLWQDDQQVPVYDRAALAVGQSFPGPAIIEERETTIVIPPGWSASVDRFGCVVATLEKTS